MSSLTGRVDSTAQVFLCCMYNRICCMLQVQQFLQFVKNIYKELPNHLHKVFEPRAQIKVKDISEINVDVLLLETFTITTILTEKKNADNMSVSVRALAHLRPAAVLLLT